MLCNSFCSLLVPRPALSCSCHQCPPGCAPSLLVVHSTHIWSGAGYKPWDTLFLTAKNEWIFSESSSSRMEIFPEPLKNNKCQCCGFFTASLSPPGQEFADSLLGFVLDILTRRAVVKEGTACSKPHSLLFLGRLVSVNLCFVCACAVFVFLRTFVLRAGRLCRPSILFPVML